MDEKPIKPTSIRISEEVLEKLKKEAKEQKRSVSKQIEYIITKYYKLKEE